MKRAVINKDKTALAVEQVDTFDVVEVTLPIGVPKAIQDKAIAVRLYFAAKALGVDVLRYENTDIEHFTVSDIVEILEQGGDN